MDNVMQVFPAPSPHLPEILFLHGQWRKHKTAVICEDERLSWLEFTQQINRFAHGLQALGLKTGDRVVVLMSNSIDMVVAMFGIMNAGCVSVPINLSVSDDALDGMIADSDASLVIASGDQLPRLVGRELPSLHYLCNADPATGWLSFEQLCDGMSVNFPAVAIDDDDLLNIIYSSGTTGLPKGIAHTFKGRRDWAYDLAIALRYHGGARTLLTIGLYSNISWVAMLATLLAGGTLIVHRQFDADKFWRDAAAYRVSHTAMVPIQFQRVIESALSEHADTSCFDGLMSCGSPLPVGLKRQLFDKFSCGIIELYGLTEGVITTLDPEDAEGRMKSVGKPLIGTDLVLIGDNDQPVDTGESGEICSRGRITMPFYYNRPDATEEASWQDDEGRVWLRTGDIGHIDDEGFLYIVDRKKDMILSGGQNIYPQDIEAVLIENENVNDVAVIAANSKRWGETPIALVVAETPDTDAQQILQWANERLGKQQRLTDVLFIDELPRNPNGKILKRELRKTYAKKEYA